MQTLHHDWLAVEQYRIDSMELWPDGPKKEAGLAAARSALNSLSKRLAGESSFCSANGASKRQAVTLDPYSRVIHRVPLKLAA